MSRSFSQAAAQYVLCIEVKCSIYSKASGNTAKWAANRAFAMCDSRQRAYSVCALTWTWKELSYIIRVLPSLKANAPVKHCELHT